MNKVLAWLGTLFVLFLLAFFEQQAQARARAVDLDLRFSSPDSTRQDFSAPRPHRPAPETCVLVLAITGLSLMN
jgi:hypothetical protein